MSMLLLLALLCIGGAVFLASEAATYPSRLKARSIKRASEYGRVHIPRNELELLHFRERVVAPAAARLASIPLKLNPRTNVATIGKKIVGAGLNQRLTVSSFLAIKGATTVFGGLLGLLLGVSGSFASAVFFVPVFATLGFLGPDWVLTLKIRSRREAIRSDLPDALDLLAVSVEAGLGFDGAVTDQAGTVLDPDRACQVKRTAGRRIALADEFGH